MEKCWLFIGEWHHSREREAKAQAGTPRRSVDCRLYRAKITRHRGLGVWGLLGADWSEMSKGSESFLLVLRTVLRSVPVSLHWEVGRGSLHLRAQKMRHNSGHMLPLACQRSWPWDHYSGTGHGLLGLGGCWLSGGKASSLRPVGREWKRWFLELELKTKFNQSHEDPLFH